MPETTIKTTLFDVIQRAAVYGLGVQIWTDTVIPALRYRVSDEMNRELPTPIRYIDGCVSIRCPDDDTESCLIRGINHAISVLNKGPCHDCQAD